MRKQIIASSWKMHIVTISDGVRLATEICNLVGNDCKVEKFILPPFPMISPLANVLEGSSIGWGAQNMSYEEEGAFTGEVPAAMLKEIGCQYVEVGHSECRELFYESDARVSKKVKLCQKYDMIPIICIGEKQPGIDWHETERELRPQVVWALDKLDHEFRKKAILAYGPIWAIGGSKPARPEYVQQSHVYIRKVLHEAYGYETADAVRIIYSGSVTSENSKELLKCPDIDGLFIGRSGLDAQSFKQITESAY